MPARARRRAPHRRRRTSNPRPRAHATRRVLRRHAFQLRAWKALTEIPFGETRSYGDQAQRLGSPAAARAVGAANGRNPLSIVIPCHRLVGAHGDLTGFAGGLDVKRALLAHEAR